MKGLAFITVCAMASTCGTTSATTADDTTPPDAETSTLRAPILEPRGPPLQATIPLLGGGSTQTAALRGRVVLLELSATDRAVWPVAQARFRGLVDQLGEERLVVVSVAIDPQPTDLRRYWDRDKPPFTLAWDPQGALALRLGATTLPTAYVLDRQGRRLAKIAGGDDYVERIEAVVRAAVNQVQDEAAQRDAGP
jgi:hypothetical protein